MLAPRHAFTPAAYLADRWQALLIGAIVVASLWLIAAVLNLSIGSAAIILSVVILGGCTLLTCDYLRRRRFYQDLEDLAPTVSTPAHLTALLDEPAFLEGRVATEAIGDMIRHADEGQTALRDAFGDYRAYIETWVHEVKTPLAAAQLMAARLDGPDAFPLARELDRIESQVQAVLYYARTATMAGDYLLRETALAPIVREACRKNARLLIEHDCTPTIDLDEELSVVTDRHWLGFMLAQIIVNAAKYGATTIRFSLVDRLETTSAGHTTLEIADDGWGISAADAPRVFDRGFTGENGRKLGQATGMGLYLVATMASAMGLGVGLATEVGVGTRILLRFPHSRVATPAS